MREELAVDAIEFLQAAQVSPQVHSCQYWPGIDDQIEQIVGAASDLDVVARALIVNAAQAEGLQARVINVPPNRQDTHGHEHPLRGHSGDEQDDRYGDEAV